MSFRPTYAITNKIAAALTKIERARGFLEAAKLSEDWITEMQNRALVLEAHHTTHIEGTHLTLAQSKKLLAGKQVAGVNPNDARELLNYRTAFKFVADNVERQSPVTEGMIREIHRLLVKGVRGGSAAPGKYRVVQNYVVNAATGEIIYTPPAANEVPLMMRDLIVWLNSRTKAPQIIKAGIAQFQLVHIHPFLDGNGRTARLLSTAWLYRSGYDFRRLFSLSEYYDRDRPAYYRSIQGVREGNMDLTGWLEYFTVGLATQMQEVRRQGEAVIRQDLLLSKAHKEGLKERPAALLAFLIKRGKGTIGDLESAFPISRRTLQRDLRMLAEHGFVRQVGSSTTDPTKYYEPLL